MTRRFYVLLVGCLLAAGLGWGCAGSTDPGTGTQTNNSVSAETCEDKDNDGYLGLTAQCEKGTDCDDSNNTIHPGAEEVCGDGRDNDCQHGDEPCQATCVDQDGDRYGDGEGCLGPDCDDTNPDINPRAQEVCGNGVDEDCDGTDNACPTNCTDDDRDGYGIAGHNTDCPSQGVDCDDTDDTINPDAQETCNGIDDNCDGNVDECPQDGASCSGTGPDATCKVAIGGTCQTDDDCADPARCDSTVSQCRLPEGEACTADNECLKGYVCDSGKCSGDFCAITDCASSLGYCDANAERCVECRYWDASSNYGDDDCPQGEGCSLEGFCGKVVHIADSQPVTGHETVTNDIYEMSIAVADCWKDKYHSSNNDLCAMLYVDSAVDSPLTENELDDAFTSGKLDFLTQDRYDALDDVWGHGWTNVKNMDWRADPQPDSFFEYCIWYDTAWTDDVTVGKCTDYAP